MLVTDPSLGEDRKMCPKHGVAHGVCVDPIRTSHVPLTDESFGGLEKWTTELKANRFDPFEALDKIAGLRVLGLDEIGGDSCLGDFDAVRVHLGALRAYITGMEK